MTAREARALLSQEDLQAVGKWSGSQSDVIKYEVNCVVCGAPNTAVVQRINFYIVEDAKYLCFDCQDYGWAWMDSLLGQGTVTEHGPTSSVEYNARPGGDSTLVNRALFGSIPRMQHSTQNPVVEYKPIRKFTDDTLMLKLSRCKRPRDIDEGNSWFLWADKMEEK